MTDATGATVSYGYKDNIHQMLGLASSVVDPAGTVTNYDYNVLGRMNETSIANTAKVSYNYDTGNLTEVIRELPGGTRQTYNFEYDAFGNMESAKVGDRLLASYKYFTGNGQLKKLTYGNEIGDNHNHVKYTYDTLGRTKTAEYSGGRKLTYAYNGEGQLHSITDTGTGSTAVQHLYTYDSLGRLISSEKLIGETPELRTSQSYDKHNRPVTQSLRLPDSSNPDSHTYTYTYNSSDGSIATFTPGTGAAINVLYDSLRRVSKMTGNVTRRHFEYRNISDTQTTTQVASIYYPELAVELTYGYEYDPLGNIAEITDPLQGTRTYTYDAQGQMTKEIIGSATYTYKYDNAGNITESTNSTGSHTYTYDNSEWGDLLTAYDGQPITYDAIGNPTSYYNGTAWNFTWANGRELVSASNEDKSITYQYDANGLRYKKIVDGVEHTYYYMGDKLVRMTVGTDKVMDFTYDQNGQPYSATYNGTKAYYVLNQQGDVVRIVTAGGASRGVYYYDAWGNILYNTDNDFLNYNPLRYRGYVYDTETGLYYCQSRYYDPALGRFLNADAFASTGQGIIGNNMFAYCKNNPIQYMDASGTAATLVQPLGNGISQKDLIKEVIKKLLEPIHLTSSTGLTASGSLTGFWGGSVQGGCSFDAQGNAAIQGAYAGGLTGGSAGLMIGGYNTITNAPNIFKLEGESCQIGGSATILLSGIPFVIGVDVNLIPDSNAGKMYFGITRTFGIAILGAGGEGHVEWGSTGTLPGSEINHIDVIIDIFDRR